MANSISAGTVMPLTPTVASRSVPAGQEGEGQHIDRVSSANNPLYAVSSARPALAGGTTSPGWGQHGFRHQPLGGGLLTRNAKLIDEPRLPGAGNNSNQRFETTCLAAAGTQAGTYYGSVNWGWEKDGTGNFRLLPLSLRSAGAPSAIFQRAAQLWNDGRTSSGGATVDLPVPLERETAGMTTPQLIARIGTATTASERTVLWTALGRRTIEIDVHQLLGNDVAGGDEIYVVLERGGRRHRTQVEAIPLLATKTFRFPASSLVPLDGPISVHVHEEDLIFDDQVAAFEWASPFATTGQLSNGYRVDIRFQR